MTGLCVLGFNFSRVYKIRVVTLTLERSDASTCNGRKDNGREAAKEDEFVPFALITHSASSNATCPQSRRPGVDERNSVPLTNSCNLKWHV